MADDVWPTTHYHSATCNCSECSARDRATGECEQERLTIQRNAEIAEAADCLEIALCAAFGKAIPPIHPVVDGPLIRLRDLCWKARAEKGSEK